MNNKRLESIGKYVQKIDLHISVKNLKRFMSNILESYMIVNRLRYFFIFKAVAYK